MNLLLGLIASVGLTSPAANVINNINLNNAIIENINEYEKVDLTKIKLDPITINVEGISAKSEEEIIEYITLEILFASNDEIIVDALFDYLDNPKLWSLSGYNFVLPKPGESINTKLYYRPLGGHPIYKGVIATELTIKNGDEVIEENLKDYITTTNLGTIVNPNEDLIYKLVLDKNPDLKLNMFEIKEYTYDKVVLEGKEQFKSQTAEIYFKSQIKFENSFKSKDLSVKAYNSTQYQRDSFVLTHNPVFGKNNFTNYFSTIRFDYTGKSAIENQSSLLPLNHKGTLAHNIGSGKQEIWNRKYSGTVNWNESMAHVQSKWTNDNKLEIVFDVEVRAYASWINAYYSRAEGQLNIDNVIIE
ncbi:hypothetical protein [Spiroplasma monobiae]|uniref:Uncharacterized protein n=1 Tax=Spiroplasma monobiae MQ-1 TaxID=1336748 RepID=A0A2K9LYE1_SPISQ|nr:hypothetical protein [Spiroplasma monobiae]AUM62764.1 hypothetical protein SMONO_v1c05150 [Spiroplasma monobiae MQ-1]